jgi:hypothetical protein
MKRFSWILCTAALALPAAAAEQTGYMLRSADLKAKPFLDADALVKLPERTPVEVLKQQGAWLQVKVRNQQGFVRLLQVRLNVNGTALAAATPATPMSSTPRPSGAGPTVTSGVRGFDEVALKSAQPNPDELKKMQGFAATTERAREFAQQAQVGARQVAYFDETGKPMKGGK